MTLNEYQAAAHSTAVYPHRDETQSISYCALGLAGEAGEVADKVKKAIRDNNGLFDSDREKALIDELGDTLWYLAEFASVLGIKLEYIAGKNLRKLADRRASNTLHGR